MKYTARDHAFVYGVIAQAALESFADCGDALDEGIKRYGNQRGARMCQTAAHFGDGNAMQQYLAYGEWAPAPGEMDIRIPESSPSAVWNVHKCPWQQEWAEQNMLDVGKRYCDYVDYALVKGFNHNLELGIGTTQTKGDEFCFFRWNGADMTPEHAAENKNTQEKIGKLRMRSWLYHMAHIYKTLGEVFEERCGRDVRQTLYRKADERIAARYGTQCVEQMHAGLLVDFWSSPTGKPAALLPTLFEEG